MCGFKAGSSCTKAHGIFRHGLGQKKANRVRQGHRPCSRPLLDRRLLLQVIVRLMARHLPFPRFSDFVLLHTTTRPPTYTPPPTACSVFCLSLSNQLAGPARLTKADPSSQLLSPLVGSSAGQVGSQDNDPLYKVSRNWMSDLPDEYCIHASMYVGNSMENSTSLRQSVLFGRRTVLLYGRTSWRMDINCQRTSSCIILHSELGPGWPSLWVFSPNFL